MKVIDLLNKIANGEEVPLIKYRDKILHWNKEKDRFEDKDGMNTLYEMDFSELNDEVEIIEEDKGIEEIDVLQKILSKDKIEGLTEEVQDIEKKLNEIIKVLNEMREDK